MTFRLRCILNFSGCSIVVLIDLWSCIKKERKKKRKNVMVVLVIKTNAGMLNRSHAVGH